MDAIKEIGLLKSVRFFVLSIYLVFVNVSVFPQIRRLLLNLSGAHIGKNSIIMSIKLLNSHQHGLNYLTIGQSCFIGEDTHIDLYDRVKLQDHVTLANRVTILTHMNVGYKNHPLQRTFPSVSKSVDLRYGCFIGAGAIILPGVTIGENSVVAAGSVVTTNVSKFTLVAGVPARRIKTIPQK